MFRNRSLTFKLILFFSGSSTLIFLLIVGSNYTFSKNMLRRNIEQNAQNLTLRTVNKIETVLASVKKIPENMAYFVQESNFDKERMVEMLRMIVSNNDEIRGAGIAFEPYAFDQKELYFAPYYYKEGGKLKLDYFGAADYRYFYEDWYQIPKELNAPAWSEPYFDEIIMTTYSVPFYENIDGQRRLKGIICADISLEWLEKIVSSVKVLETGDAYLISRNGTIITHALKELIMNESLFSVAEARGDPQLREIARKMIKGESGFVPFTSIARNKKCWMYYAPVPSTGWALVVVFPEDEFLADIRRHNLVVGGLGLGGMLLLIIVIVLISRSITRPLRAMAKAAGAIGRGNLDIELPVVKSGDEIGKLAQAFAYMKISLKDYINKLTEATAAKERIESELKIAKEIQVSMLPRIFPPFPDRQEFDTFAMMEPAKEVGGDFYDFFLINDKRLCFLMGDVSGKGVPAALFMMITKILLKNEALQNTPVNELLYRVNNILALDNNTSMFATIFCAILDTQTGEVEFANAGHNPPLIYRKGGDFEFLAVDKSFVLGPMQNTKFSLSKTRLNPGDMFFLYTDGVTEAMNPKKEFFSENRLKQALSDLKEKDITEIIRMLKIQISEFARGEPQSDDITMLVLKYFG
ncbi:MAG: SpoIIE family protein phosphatase [Candidatus Omnitrophota bacterium]